MKFGRDFHTYIVPEWYSSYVLYAQLKQDFKSAILESVSSGRSPDLQIFRARLRASIEDVRTFHRKQCAFIEYEHKRISNFAEFRASTYNLSAVNEADKYASTAIQDAVSQLQQRVANLQLHLRTNDLAIAKLHSKLRDVNIDDTDDDDTATIWKEFRLEYRVLYLQIGQRLANLDTPFAIKSTDEQRTPCSESLESNGHSEDLNLDIGFLRAITASVASDDHVQFNQFFNDLIVEERLSRCQKEQILINLLSVALRHRSRGCVLILISRRTDNKTAAISTAHILETLKFYESSNTHVAAGVSDPGEAALPSSHLESETFKLQILKDRQLDTSEDMTAQDDFARTLLHHLVECRSPAILKSLLRDRLQDVDVACTVLSGLLGKDFEGQTPLHYAVTNHDDEMMQLLIEMLSEIDHKSELSLRQDTLADVLNLAMLHNRSAIVELLLSHQLGVPGRNSHGETALHMAVKLGRPEYVALILSDSNSIQTLNTPDTANAWTPLFVACVHGYLEIAKLLMQAGADCLLRDVRGWYAQELAAFRGFVELAGLFEPQLENFAGCSLIAIPSVRKAVANEDASSNLSHVIVNFGSCQKTRLDNPVRLFCHGDDLDSLPAASAEFLMEMSIRGGSAKHRVQLPLMGDLVYNPYVFRSDLSRNSAIIFKLFRTTVSGEEVLVGSGVIFLDQSHHLDQKRESLTREYSASIISQESLDCIAVVTITILISKPYNKLQDPSEADWHFGQEPFQIIGHRGLGQNLHSSYLQLGENTVQSFLSAMAQGATWVEFDLQMTRDLVPVAYHDLSLSESGTDVPIHDLSLQQFLYAGIMQSSNSAIGGGSSRSSPIASGTTSPTRRQRSLSLKIEESVENRALQDRMKHTFDFSDKGFKPNTRGRFIQEQFATLEGLLRGLPEHVRLDIEIKYPRVHETTDADIAPIALDINLFVDRTLDVLHEYGGNRIMILSSFSPETCILLKLKQKRYPVMFITNAGKPPDKDKEVRTASVQAAYHFTRDWGFQAVCYASEPVILCPRLIEYTKSFGFGCSSYGPLNNIPENARVQVGSGLDLIVVDRVGLIYRTLGMHLR